MAGRDIIVIGASMGGVNALMQVVRGLPPGLAASLFVVCHFPADWPSKLPDVLSRAGPLLAAHAINGEPFYPGHIYVAPADRHLILVPGGWMRLTRGPRENHHRPAIDPLFRSAARNYGPRTVGVVLSGALTDGTAGLLALRAAGGLAVVQDPRDALMAAMPLNATQIAGADYVVPAGGLAALLVDLVRCPGPGPGDHDMPDPIDTMPDTVLRDMQRQIGNGHRGSLSLFSCPECGGALWQVDEDSLIRFRCHVGHIYNGETLLAEQAQTLEAALWTAARIFKERCILARQLANQERDCNNPAAAARFDEQADLAERYSHTIQQYVLGSSQPPGAQPDLPPGGKPPPEESA
jgi:two-component system chemotaxis response regulator CheB